MSHNLRWDTSIENVLSPWAMVPGIGKDQQAVPRVPLKCLVRQCDLSAGNDRVCRKTSSERATSTSELPHLQTSFPGGSYFLDRKESSDTLTIGSETLEMK